jgi:propionyl-CoA synthetase
MGFVVLKAGVNRNHDEIIEELVAMVRNEIGAVASFRQCVIVRALPKTRSGKTLRGTIRKIADGESFVIPSTIEDATVLDVIAESVKKIGYGKQ